MKKLDVRHWERMILYRAHAAVIFSPHAIPTYGVRYEASRLLYATDILVMVAVHCYRRSHLTHAADATDRPFLLGQEQYVIWSMGPVGTLDTFLGTTIPVPFRHFVQPSRTGRILPG